MRRRTVAAVVTVLIAGVSACAVVERRRRRRTARLFSANLPAPVSMSSGGDSGPPEGLTVAIIGDSIIYLAAPEIRKALQGSYSFTVLADRGAKIGDLEPLTDPLLSPGLHRVPDAIVVNLGTNDVTGRTAEWHDHWTTLMDRLAAAPWLVLFTINRHADQLGKRYLDGPSAEDINDAIARASEPPNVLVVDWDAAVQSDVELVWDRRTHEGDFVHPSAKGQQWIADQIRATLRSCSHTPA